MYRAILIASAFAATFVAGAPLTSSSPNATGPQLDTTGFVNAEISYSQGGHAVCVSGIVQVAATTNANVRLNISSSLTADQATQIILNVNTLSASKYLTSVITGKSTQGGTWNISSRLCFPSNQSSAHAATTSTVQLLTHGLAFDKTYWDYPNPSNGSKGAQSQTSGSLYSYVDFAAQQGQVTFSYDRLGVGASSQPDPIQVVQGPLELEILHSLVSMLRAGHISNTSFNSIIGVGHSYGSGLTTAVAKTYPTDFDAVVLTGFSANTTGAPQFTSSLNLLPASAIDPARFSSLAPGYLVPSTQYGVQYAFFAYPDFDDSVLIQAYKTVQTITVGEQTTMALIAGVAANFTRPVYVIDGNQDLFFCDGYCDVLDAKNQTIPAQTITRLFPAADAAKSSSFSVQGAGHGLNLAYNATVAFEKIQQWIAGL